MKVEGWSIAEAPFSARRFRMHFELRRKETKKGRNEGGDKMRRDQVEAAARGSHGFSEAWLGVP
jgi:hypothetical protein